MKLNVEERAEKARELFKSGYNCSQAVALTFCDIMGVDENIVKNAAAGFGGGVGRMREVCGAVSGMAMVSGFLKPFGNDDKQAKTANYALVQSLAGKFKENFGSIICRDLLEGQACGRISPVPSDRTEEYYKKRTCDEKVAYAAATLAAAINEMDGNV